MNASGGEAFRDDLIRALGESGIVRFYDDLPTRPASAGDPLSIADSAVPLGHWCVAGFPGAKSRKSPCDSFGPHPSVWAKRFAALRALSTGGDVRRTHRFDRVLMLDSDAFPCPGFERLFDALDDEHCAASHCGYDVAALELDNGRPYNNNRQFKSSGSVYKGAPEPQAEYARFSTSNIFVPASFPPL